MSILDILYTIFIMPLQLSFEVIYVVTDRIIGNPGLSIVALSLMMNFLVLPLYMRADKMQEHERDMEAKLRDGVKHIRKTFSGDEKSMMLSTYYRQNGYRPTDVFKGSISLFLEIPFFISAYMFLSHLPAIRGVPFGPIADLGSPDGLLVIGGFAINVLPFIMTGINLVSCALFTKGMPTKTKVQLYGMAAFFLVFLYSSPAGLVFYWTLNNLFALVKTIFYKLKNPKRILKIMGAVAGIVLIICGLFFLPNPWLDNICIVVGLGIICLLPALITGVKLLAARRRERAGALEAADAATEAADTAATGEATTPPAATTTSATTAAASAATTASEVTTPASAAVSATPTRKRPKLPKPTHEPSKRFFLAGTVFLTVLVGVLIPSAVIGSSPQEFLDTRHLETPIWFIVSSGCLAAGMFLVWFSVFYWLCNRRAKLIFETAVWVCCVLGVINYMFFGTDLGTLNSMLQYLLGMYYTYEQAIINGLVLTAVGLAAIFIARRARKWVPRIISIGTMALLVLSVINFMAINDSVSKVMPAESGAQTKSQASFNLSRDGKNVVVIMLDRALNEYAPYIFAEKPEIAASFAGFTYFDNIVSFGGSTNIAAPALFGGYEYTPENMNKRDDVSLERKNDEALRVMPVLFDDAGYDVTVCDPSYAGYNYTPDLTIYKDHPNIATYNTDGTFSDYWGLIRTSDMRNFFCFAVMKCFPLAAQPTLYDDGRYNSAGSEEGFMGNQRVSGDLMYADGIFPGFMKAYEVLENLPTMSKVTDDGSNNFLMMVNYTAHEPMLLQEPDYVPSAHVDNSEYEAAHPDRFTLDGITLKMESAYQLIHYHANMAAYTQIANWLNWMREQGVYDNTRIIIVADHGRSLRHLPSMFLDDGKTDGKLDTEFYYPLLMYKDFGATELTTSSEFMTNADTPLLALGGLIENPVNPATGNTITNSEKLAHDQHVLASDNWILQENNGNTFKMSDSYWLAVHDDMRDMSNWTILDDTIE